MLYFLFQKLEFVRLIDKYGLRGAALTVKTERNEVPDLKLLDCLPCYAQQCAIYLAQDGTLAVACKDGVCVMTPLEVQMGFILPDGNHILHDAKSVMHALEALGVSLGEVGFDTAVAAYNLNPSSSDYSVSKLVSRA